MALTMADITASARLETDLQSGYGVSVLISLLVFCYFWITLTPLSDLSGSASGATSNVLNQLAVILIAGIVLLMVAMRQAWQFLASPKFLIFTIFACLLCTSFIGNDPASSLRRIIFSALVVMCASSFLLLAKNARAFSSVLAWGVSLALALSYFGVLLMPALAVHQGSDAVEAVLAGDWRGHFAHKNIASAAMVISVFIGLYVRATVSRNWGIAIVLAAGVFLVFTGGKTALGMLPIVLFLAFLFEHIWLSRLFVTIGGVAAINYLLLGSAMNREIRDWIASLGIDATFTGRTDIWRFSLEKIAESPVFGQGFQAFWQTNSLRFGGDDVETWVVTAAHSHNSYLEMIINAGFPGLVLVLLLLVILPIYDGSRALKGNNDKNLTRLFLRIWLFCIYLACLESFFFSNTGPLWFSMLIAVFGLRLQGRAALVKPSHLNAGFERRYVQ